MFFINTINVKSPQDSDSTTRTTCAAFNGDILFASKLMHANTF